MAMPILKAFAKERDWEYRYFDTAFYEKGDDSILDKEATGGFKPSKADSLPETLSRDLVITNFQKIIDVIDSANRFNLEIKHQELLWLNPEWHTKWHTVLRQFK